LWLAEAITAIGVRTVRHHGAHRYAFSLGLTSRDRAAARVALPACANPKRADG
jgi:hypothetical protein